MRKLALLFILLAIAVSGCGNPHKPKREIELEKEAEKRRIEQQYLEEKRRIEKQKEKEKRDYEQNR